jgi:hypothetical protein
VSGVVDFYVLFIYFSLFKKKVLDLRLNLNFIKKSRV